MEPVWDIVHAALDHTNASMIFLERDTAFLPFEGIMSDIRKAREIFYRHRPSTPPGAAPSSAAPAVTVAAGGDGIDPLAPQFSNLRSYQRAVMRQITDAGFRQRFKADSCIVMDEYPMSPEWKSRLEGCNQDRLGHMAVKWPETEKVEKEIEEDLKRLEWRAWAAQNAW
jgi:hypothetical protein